MTDSSALEAALCVAASLVARAVVGWASVAGGVGVALSSRERKLAVKTRHAAKSKGLRKRDCRGTNMSL